MVVHLLSLLFGFTPFGIEFGFRLRRFRPSTNMTKKQAKFMLENSDGTTPATVMRKKPNGL